MTESDLTARINALELRLDQIETLLRPSTPPSLSTRQPVIETIEPVPDQPRPSRVPVRRSGLEHTIGLKWAGWVGAVVLVIGAGLGIKFAYDHGWFTHIPPIVRLGILALVAAGLIGAGEAVYRRVNPLAAVGLFGAGVAVLFLTSYAGHVFYNLYPRDTAFAFMALCTIVGAVVARRGDMVSIAVVALIGGNLAPWLLSDNVPQLPGFLVYLLMLQATSLLLAYWGAKPKWWTLRALSLATTCIWLSIVIDDFHQELLLEFSVLTAGLYQLELLVSAIKSPLVPPRSGATFSLLVSAALTAMGLYLLRDSSQAIRLTFVLGFAGTAGVAASICARVCKPGTAPRELGYGYAIQSLALIALAMPIAFSGIWISAAWGLLALAMSLLGWMPGLPTARWGGPIVWALGVANLMLITAGLHAALTGFSTAGIAFPQSTLMSWFLALIGQPVAKLTLAPRHRPVTEGAKTVATALSMLASCIWVIAAVCGLSPLPATASVLIYAAALVLFDLFDSDLNFLLQAASLGIAAAAKWALVDLLAHRLTEPARMDWIFLNTQGFSSAMVVIATLLIFIRARSTVATSPHSRSIVALALGAWVGSIFWIATFAIDQAFTNLRFSDNPIFTDPQLAEQGALSIFWSVFALVAVVAGFAWRIAGLRYFGLALFACTLLKVVSIDLSDVSTGYRILSCLGLGLLLLGTSVLYGKVSPLLLAGSKAAPPNVG